MHISKDAICLEKPHLSLCNRVRQVLEATVGLQTACLQPCQSLLLQCLGRQTPNRVCGSKLQTCGAFVCVGTLRHDSSYTRITAYGRCLQHLKWPAWLCNDLCLLIANYDLKVQWYRLVDSLTPRTKYNAQASDGLRPQLHVQHSRLAPA